MPAIGACAALMDFSGPLQAGSDQAKKKAINCVMAIEKLGLSARLHGINLQLSDSLDLQAELTSPGKNGSNHLLPAHCETLISPFAKPDGMGLMRINPGQSNWPGFSGGLIF